MHIVSFTLAGKRAGGVSDSALLKQLKAFIKEEMGRQTEDLIEELKLLHDKQRNDRFRATADDRKERQKNTLILAEMESVRNEVSKLRRDIKNIFRIPGKQSSSSRRATQKRDKRSGRHRKKRPKTKHRKWRSKYSSTSEDSEFDSMSDTEDSDSTEEETTEDETDSSQESIDEKYFKTDKYKPRPTKTRNSSVSKVCTHPTSVSSYNPKTNANMSWY